jgi:hypothetical protein
MQKLSARKFHVEAPFTSFDHLVGAGEEGIWYFEAHSLRPTKSRKSAKLARHRHPQQVSAPSKRPIARGPRPVAIRQFDLDSSPPTPATQSGLWGSCPGCRIACQRGLRYWHETAVLRVPMNVCSRWKSDRVADITAMTDFGPQAVIAGLEISQRSRGGIGETARQLTGNRNGPNGTL